jgi:hypothetical protein
MEIPYYKTQEFINKTEGEKREYFDSVRKENKRIADLERQGKLTYKTLEITDTERGRKEVRTTYSGDKNSNPTSQTTTIAVKSIEGEQPTLKDIAPNPQRQTKSISAQMLPTSERYVENLLKSGYYDLEKRQSISQQEKIKREQDLVYENTNTRNQTVDSLKKERFSVQKTKNYINKYLLKKEGRQEGKKVFYDVGKQYLKSISEGSKNVFTTSQALIGTVLDTPSGVIKEGKDYNFINQFEKNYIKQSVLLRSAGKDTKNPEVRKNIFSDVKRSTTAQGLQDFKTFTYICSIY